MAENIFWYGNSSSRKEEKIVLSTSTPFVIRQSIEYKLKRVLGIQYVLKEGKIDKTKVGTYFDIFRSCQQYYRFKNIDLDIIETIHSWSHFYVHSGLRAEPWRTETALYYINKLNYKGTTSDSSLLSVYASIEIDETNVEKVKQQAEVKIKEVIVGDAEIIWDPHPEVAVIKQKNKE